MDKQTTHLYSRALRNSQKKDVKAHHKSHVVNATVCDESYELRQIYVDSCPIVHIDSLPLKSQVARLKFEQEVAYSYLGEEYLFGRGGEEYDFLGKYIPLLKFDVEVLVL